MTPERLAEIKRSWHGWTVTDLIAEIERLRTEAEGLRAEMDRLQNRLQNALGEIIKFNPLRNDRDAYLLAIAEWGIKGKWGIEEEFTDRPRAIDFGLE